MPVQDFVMCAALDNFKVALRASNAMQENFKRKTIKHHARAALQANIKTRKRVLFVSHVMWANLAPVRWPHSLTARRATWGSSRIVQVAHRVCLVSPAHLVRDAVGVRTGATTVFASVVRLGSSMTRLAVVRVCSVPLANFRMRHSRPRALSVAVARLAPGKGAGAPAQVSVPCAHPDNFSTRH